MRETPAPAAESALPAPAPARRRSPRSLHSAVAVASPALGYGGYLGYNWFVEGRFLVIDRRRLCRREHGDHRRQDPGVMSSKSTVADNGGP